MIFVVFSLYLLRDAFYRWDGFRYYASFVDFIPSVALVSILWTLVAAFIALVVFVSLRILEILCKPVGLRFKFEYLVMFPFVLLLSTGVVYGVKQLYRPEVSFVRSILLYVFFASIFLTWIFRSKARRLSDFIEERITPLVWLFGVFVMISVPLVAYHTWLKQPVEKKSHAISVSLGKGEERPNIILITFDALSARNMSVYGYHRDTTPFISEWAKNASVFKWVEAESGYTIPTTTSLMTGKRVWTHQRYHLDDARRPVKGSTENLAYVLKNNGYYNMAFIANILASVDALGIADSFDVAPLAVEFSNPVTLRKIVEKYMYILFGEKIRLYNWIVKEDFILGEYLEVLSRDVYTTTVPPEKAFNRFLEIIDSNPPEPFFAWIHLLPPHGPYLPPKPYMGLFNSSSTLNSRKSQWRERDKKIFMYCHGQISLQEIQKIISILEARYDEFIRYCDKEFEHFISQLKRRNKLEDTVIIISSDHGEAFRPYHVGHGGEFRENIARCHATQRCCKWLYGGGLSEEITRIPLIIKEPGQTQGRVINDLVEQIDIPATILDLAGIPIPSWMEGRSLVPLLRGGDLPSRPAFSMSLLRNPARGQKITKGIFVVWEGDYKLAYNTENGEVMLFNLKKDPYNVNNIFDDKPDIGRHLLELIKENLKTVNERIGIEE